MPTALPFAGELIQVRADATDWEGAAERVLHNFALSLLVPSHHYDAVAAGWTRRHLGARLVYYRVPANVTDRRRRRTGRAAIPYCSTCWRSSPTPASRSGCRQSSAGGPTTPAWRPSPSSATAAKAVTRAGQVKDRERHEKDDRRRIGDRREYVLGWSNQQKIEAMIAHAAALHRRQSSSWLDEVAHMDKPGRQAAASVSSAWPAWTSTPPGTTSTGRRWSTRSPPSATNGTGSSRLPTAWPRSTRNCR